MNNILRGKPRYKFKSYFRYQSLLVQYPIINTFDLLCLNRRFDHIEQLNHLPFCKKCNQTLKNLNGFKIHCKKKHKTS